MTTTALLERLPLSGLASSHQSIASIPAFIYGTAWKKESSADLVYKAIKHGFTAVDTAAQPKHYREDLVADGIRQAIKDKLIQRKQLYIQTKFTSTDGQDPNSMPYDAKAPLQDQVNGSVISSIRNFSFADVVQPDDVREPYIDTVVLHSPMPTMTETLEVWQTLEQYVPTEIRSLGISNCNLFTIMELFERASVKPAVVQNRFYGSAKYDIGLRKFCRENGIIYQSFWTLTANPNILKAEVTQKLALSTDITPAAALYCLVLGLDNTIVLNGTTSTQNMQADLEAVRKVAVYMGRDQVGWTKLLESFRELIGERRT